ncbi:MAG: DUF512 domain-containing protein [Coriobacteriia bacterium]|nr:DUF512 domain-containing protein [Coriobacteriia bacterium]
MMYSHKSFDAAGASIVSVEAGSPAVRAGLKPGMAVCSVDGEPLCDILDWHWLSDGLAVELAVEQGRQENVPRAPLRSSDARLSQHVLTRQVGEPWGITFAEVIFDGLRHCVNECSFCFMKMLPSGMRSSLYVRDDDYRLSFLQGNFVTLTNVSDEDVKRIVRMHLSPLNVSLHAVDPGVRTQLMGNNHARGIDLLEHLLEAGIECKAQIVLQPQINDGAVLDETLAWIAQRSGITATGIVPYGYTRYAKIQKGYDTAGSARALIQQLKGGAPQVQLADEFFIKAWPGEVLKYLPAAGYYGEYPLLADGIGMLRSWIDGPESKALYEQLKAHKEQLLVTGEAFASVLHELWPQLKKRILAINNNYFGGNVDVAGLLTAKDIIEQARRYPARSSYSKLLLPPTMFNDDGLTLDNKTADDIAKSLELELAALSWRPALYPSVPER